MNTLPPQVLNLRKIWNHKQNEMHFTQTDASKKLNWSQGAISHYLNNITDLGPAAVIKFANFLHVDPTEIDPNIEEHLNIYKTYKINTTVIPEPDNYLFSCVNAVTKRTLNAYTTKSLNSHYATKTYNLTKNNHFFELAGPLKITGTDFWLKPPNCLFTTYIQITNFQNTAEPKLVFVWNLDEPDKKKPALGYVCTHDYYKQNPPLWTKFKVQPIESILHY